MREHQNASDEILSRLRPICLGLAEVREERAWVGTRWRIGAKTFVHVVPIADGWPPAFVKASGTEGPATIMTFRTDPAEHEALRRSGHAFFAPAWWPDTMGLHLSDETDWAEVAELIAESYRLLAPQRLRRQARDI